VLLLAVLFVAGRQPLLSAVVAAVLYVLIPGYIDNADVREYSPIVFGALAMGAAIYGGVPVLDRLQAAKRLAQRSAERSPLRARAAAATSARQLQEVPS
jgi:hypothetical protein